MCRDVGQVVGTVEMFKMMYAVSWTYRWELLVLLDCCWYLHGHMHLHNVKRGSILTCNTAAIIMQRTETVLVRAVSVHVHASSHPLCCLQLCLQVLGESGHILLLSTQGRVCITQLCLQLTHQRTPTRKCAQGEWQALVECLKQ